MADDAGSRQSDGTQSPRVDDSVHDGHAADEGHHSPEAGTVDSGALAESLPEQMIQEAEVEDDEDGAVAGSFAPDLDVLPQSPRVENVIFVALGVYVATIAVGRMFVGASMYAPETLGAVTLGVAAGTALLYGFFTRTNPDT